jgi:hypothetical protein
MALFDCKNGRFHFFERPALQPGNSQTKHGDEIKAEIRSIGLGPDYSFY